MLSARVCSRSLGWALLAAATAIGVAKAAPADPPEAPPPGGTFGLVVTELHYAIQQTADAKECPQGFNVSQRTNYLKQFPTAAARAANEVKYGYGYGNRGPNGENALYNPEMVSDPFPYKLAVGPTAPGLNLDGKVGPNDFTSPDGRTGIDNQLYRVLGCAEGFRGKDGYFFSIGNKNIHDLKVNRIMFEVSGVDDMQNDPDVTVRSYRGLDPIVIGAGDKPTAGVTQHIDETRGRRYMTQTKGRIVDGVLITDPVDMRIPWVRNAGNDREIAYASEFTIRGMQLRVKLDGSGGEGYIGGYADLATWWNWFSKSWAQGAVIEVYSLSPPSLYKELHALADGYPDAKGVNTAISMALTTSFGNVIIEHGDTTSSPARVASANTQGSAR